MNCVALEIDAAGRLADQQHLGLLGELARHDDLLHVAARQRRHGSGGTADAHRIAFDQALGIGADLPEVEQTVADEARIVEPGRDEVLRDRRPGRQPFGEAILGNAGHAAAPACRARRAAGCSRLR